MKPGGVKERREKLPEARSKIWSAMRFLKKFSLEDLETTTGQSYPHVRRYVRRLLAAGYLRLVEESQGGKGINRYRLVRDTGPECPMPRRNVAAVFDPNSGETHLENIGPTARQQAWEFMRAGGEFGFADLMELGMQKGNALKYLGALMENGYLYQVSARTFGPGALPARYKILRDTGPEAPIVQRNGDIFDPNLEVADGDDE